MKVIKCPECEHTMDKVTFSGYPFGDRLLDGVVFVAELQEDGFLKVTGVTKECIHYFDKLNKEMWTKEAQLYVNRMIGDVFAGCEKCGYDLCMVDDVMEV